MPNPTVRPVGAATARAHANVALAKYWGKRDAALNLPATGSLSITLDGLATTARVAFTADLPADDVRFAGMPAPPEEARRISQFLDLVRAMGRTQARAAVDIRSNFPVAAGLASSASTYAALARAATAAAGLEPSDRDLSVLARRGSGSACRSIHGGFVEWLVGEAPDGSDSYAVPVAPPEHWDLAVVVAVTAREPKAVGSREGMLRAAEASPFYAAWLATHAADLEAIRRGIRERDLALVGRTAEHNCLAMHAVALAARPALLYWAPATIAVMRRVHALRTEGLDAYFTIDAGPQVKVLCPGTQREAVAAALREVDGVVDVLLARPGAGVQLLEAA